MNEAATLSVLGTPGTVALMVSAILFAIGVVGVLLHRNAIIVFMCIELMLNAVNISLVAFSRAHGMQGQILVFFVMAVAAAEAAVGLAVIIAIFRHYEVVDLDRFNLLKW
ncbi:MAG: NADH-quinone oxidoreductase subunit NuoK [Gemmatimonadota bacterium]